MTRLALHWEILIGMVVGAVIGVTCNVMLGERESQVPEESLPKGMQRISFVDTTNRVEISVEADDGTSSRLLVDPTRLGEKNVYATVERLAEKEPQMARLFERHGNSWARWIGMSAQRIGNLFLRLLQMVAVPLIVTSLVSGVMGLGHASRLGRMFGRTMLYYVVDQHAGHRDRFADGQPDPARLAGGIAICRREEPEVSADLGERAVSASGNDDSAQPVRGVGRGEFPVDHLLQPGLRRFCHAGRRRTADAMRDLFNDGFQVMMR